jgi:hypothetical protein
MLGPYRGERSPDLSFCRGRRPANRVALVQSRGRDIPSTLRLLFGLWRRLNSATNTARKSTVPLSRCPAVPLSQLSHCPDCPDCPNCPNRPAGKDGGQWRQPLQRRAGSLPPVRSPAKPLRVRSVEKFGKAAEKRKAPLAERQNAPSPTPVHTGERVKKSFLPAGEARAKTKKALSSGRGLGEGGRSTELNARAFCLAGSATSLSYGSCRSH